MTWPAALATDWHNYVPPCRPSRFELDTCTEILEERRLDLDGRRPKVLILGSTTEYRDWAFEERCECVVMDNSPQYHEAITVEVTHKHRPLERAVFADWRDLDVQNAFDLILGDLVVGNLEPGEVRPTLERISTALMPGGAFLTKSFFSGIRAPRFPTLDSVFRDYEARLAPRDPFPLLAYDLTLACTASNGLLKFEDMYREVRVAADRGVLRPETLERYSALGWNTNMKFQFYVMDVEEWTALTRRIFSRVRTAAGASGWAADFPYYILQTS